MPIDMFVEDGKLYISPAIMPKSNGDILEIWPFPAWPFPDYNEQSSIEFKKVRMTSGRVWWCYDGEIDHQQMIDFIYQHVAPIIEKKKSRESET